MEPVTPGGRLRRLLSLRHAPPHGAGEEVRRWRSLGADDLTSALGADPDVRRDSQLVAVVHELMSSRDDIPPSLKPALCRVLEVPDTYFDDQYVADREDARWLPALLSDLGVVGAHLCRCPPVLEARIHLWVSLLEVARQHAGTDHTMAGFDDY